MVLRVRLKIVVKSKKNEKITRKVCCDRPDVSAKEYNNTSIKRYNLNRRLCRFIFSWGMLHVAM